MNIILTLIVIGLCIAHFGFWASVWGFLLAIFWIIAVAGIIAALGFLFLYTLSRLT